MSGIVLVHGAWHGGWVWDGVLGALERRGVPVVAPDLPLTSFAADVATVREATAALGPGVVLCGHSYGGAVISEAASGPTDVAHLVYLCALMPGAVEPSPGMTAELRGAFLVAEDALRVDPVRAHDVFYGDCDRSRTEPFLGRLRALHRDRVAVADPAWRHLPSTYVVAARDRALDPAWQRAVGAQAGQVVEWDSDHSPMLTRPDELADLLAARLPR